jgi:hypothetical protein
MTSYLQPKSTKWGRTEKSSGPYRIRPRLAAAAAVWAPTHSPSLAPLFESNTAQPVKKNRDTPVFIGCGPYRIRTDDLLIANEALYQLS